MERIFANQISDQEIELKNNTDLELMCDLIDKEEDFILSTQENNILSSELIIVTNIASKVKTGDLKLVAKEKK